MEDDSWANSSRPVVPGCGRRTSGWSDTESGDGCLVCGARSWRWWQA